MSYPIERVRGDFPLLAREVNGQPLAYLDSAASAQKPQAVIDRELEFYRHGYAAVHRGIHTLSAEATQQMEAVREQAARFINAASAEEMVFVKGTTEGINLVANSFGRHLLQPGDAILITEMEHHANIVPWQMLAQERGLQLRVWPLQPDGTLDLARLPELVDSSCKLLALTEVSNVLGTVNPVHDIIARARALAPELTVLVDGAQAVMHQRVDVQALDCDFYVFSGHKLYGPTGIGALYGKSELLAAMSPWLGGGKMIAEVSFDGFTPQPAPYGLEAGTPNVAGVIGLSAALEWLAQSDIGQAENWSRSLASLAEEELAIRPGFRSFRCQQSSLLAFEFE
ncbi:MAG: aminotransferase class V-fold PLP-dependent enzyme, partial [Serratia marcescens]|nr:aminotransferase class V-fold PLP-dependent enzyme [Serratia marcescens]